jgi:Holliday junction resolvasome RuvABC ATP-dependent DNA helicase subunit
MMNTTSLSTDTNTVQAHLSHPNGTVPRISNDLMKRIREVLERTPDVCEERVRRAVEHWALGGADADQIATSILELHLGYRQS